MQFLMFEYYVYSEQVPKPFRSRKILTGSYCSIVFIFLPPRAHGVTMKSLCGPGAMPGICGNTY